jgi:hypothetical protein
MRNLYFKQRKYYLSSLLFLIATTIFSQKMPSPTFHITRGFSVTIKKDAGMIDAITVRAPKSGQGKLKMPFRTYWIEKSKGAKLKYIENGTLKFALQRGGYFILRNGYE